MSADVSTPTGPWFQQTLNHNSLNFLKWYLAFITAAMMLTAATFHWQGYPLPQRLYWFAIPLQVLATLAIALTSQSKLQPRTDVYLLLLLGSMLLLGWFLYDSGGHTNPLISILLLPVAMATAILVWQASVIIALCAIAIYTALTEFYLPLNTHLQGHHAHEHFMQLHLVGMWLTFALSALLLLFLVQPLAASLRKQKERVAQQRENTLRDEQLIALATFAASAAHQMGTPLSTLAVLVEDLKDFQNSEDMLDDLQSDLKTDLKTMESQIQLCKTTLHNMMQKAEQVRNETNTILTAPTLANELQKQFTLLHPNLSLQLQEPIPEQNISFTPTLEQALLNLLDNAAKASNTNPTLAVEVSENKIGIMIQDNGPGFSQKLQNNIGQPFLTSDDAKAGMGLGLFLSNATINRLGGTLTLRNNEQGTRAEVWLPVATKEHHDG